MKTNSRFLRPRPLGFRTFSVVSLVEHYQIMVFCGIVLNELGT